MKGSTKFWLAAFWGIKIYLIWFALTNADTEIRNFIVFFVLLVNEILFQILFDFSTVEKIEGNLFYRYNTIIFSLWDGIKEFNKILDDII